MKQKTVPVNQENNNVEFDHEKLMLMNKFLYEVHKQIRDKQLNKTAFASLLGVSLSYLSQVFHGSKPLTFEMLVKFQRVLKIEFEVSIKGNR